MLSSAPSPVTFAWTGTPIDGARRAHPLMDSPASVRLAMGEELVALHQRLVALSTDVRLPDTSGSLSRLLGLVALISREAFATSDERHPDVAFAASVDALLKRLHAARSRSPR